MKQYIKLINRLFVCLILLSLYSCSITKQRHINRMITPKHGVAILESYEFGYKSSWALYTLITDDGDKVEHIWTGQLLDGPYSQNYYRCEFVCWYDESDPEHIYVCQDSMIVDPQPVIQLDGQLKHVQRIRGYTKLTYQLTFNGTVFEWMESIPLSEYDRYKKLSKTQSAIPINLYLHPTRDGILIPRVSR